MTEYRRNPSRVNVDTDGIYVGKPVRGSTFEDIGRLQNWLTGDGYAVIPTNFYNLTLTDGSDYTFTWRIRGREATIHRRWKFVFYGTGATVVTVKVPSGGTGKTIRLGAERSVLYYDEYLSAQTDSEESIDCNVEPNGGAATLLLIECSAVPRTEVTGGASENAVSTAKFVPGAPIYSNDTALGRIDNAQGDSFELGRRCSLAQWALPDQVNGADSTAQVYSTTSATAVDVLEVGVPVLTRRLGPASWASNAPTHATTGSVAARIRAWKAGGGSPTVWMQATSSGSTSAQTVSAASPTWYPATGGAGFTFNMHCTDLDSTDGRQTAASPAWDVVKARAIGVGGGTTLYISGVSIMQIV